jgi:hypothetical protein
MATALSLILTTLIVVQAENLQHGISVTTEVTPNMQRMESTSSEAETVLTPEDERDINEASSAAVQSADYVRLYTDLMKNYIPEVRPVYSHRTITNVTVKVNSPQIKEVRTVFQIVII